MTRVRPIALPFALALAALASCDRGAPPAATPAPVAAPSPSAAPSPAPPLTTADVDAKLRTEWKAAAVEPCSPANDATWLRRAWLDVVGTIPPSEVVTQFLADKAPGTRARAVEDL